MPPTAPCGVDSRLSRSVFHGASRPATRGDAAPHLFHTMGYTFNCDACGERYDHAPPFMGEFRETFLKTSDSPLVHAFDIGQTVTLCRDCSEEIFR